MWPGQRNETFEKRCTRWALTLTDVLNGSVICMNKQTIIVNNNKGKKPKCAVLPSSEIASVETFVLTVGLLGHV